MAYSPIRRRVIVRPNEGQSSATVDNPAPEPENKPVEKVIEPVVEEKSFLKIAPEVITRRRPSTRRVIRRPSSEEDTVSNEDHKKEQLKPSVPARARTGRRNLMRFRHETLEDTSEGEVMQSDIATTTQATFRRSLAEKKQRVVAFDDYGHPIPAQLDKSIPF